jgi:hypothetical protein
MKRAVIIASFVLAVSSLAFAQQSQQGTAVFSVRRFASPPVLGAPYSATITDQSVQTLADGTRIVQTFNGNTARDSQGRTRQDAPVPNIGNLSAANAPHLVFIQDPVSQTSYTLNLTDKTAQKMPVPPPGAVSTGGALDAVAAAVPGPAVADKFFFQTRDGAPMPGLLPPPIQIAGMVGDDGGQTVTENLGTQTMEGVQATGTKTTHTIPAGEIGNDQPITVVTEVWTSPDLKTIVYSKRTDPRTGEQTFQLTNIVRAEPDASLFTVPSDFKVVDGPQPIIYHSNR